MPVTKKRRATIWRSSITVILLTIVIIVLATNADELQDSVQAVGHASIGPVLLAVVLVGLSYCIAAGIYQLLALRKLNYSRTVVIEIASAAANRVLPAGVGGLGLLGIYLYKQKHTPAQATAVIASNNLIGILAHLLLLAIVSLAMPSVWQNFSRHLHIHLGWLPIVVVFILVGLYFVPFIREKLQGFIKNLFSSFKLYVRQPLTLVGSLFLAILMTITFTAILYLVTRALHATLSPVNCFVVFSIGMLAATATPTPGGLVGAEAGLFAGFSSYGLSAPNALAATLLFRLIAYWLPVIPGIAALLYSRRRHWV